jgi:hypothetical protein
MRQVPVVVHTVGRGMGMNYELKGVRAQADIEQGSVHALKLSRQSEARPLGYQDLWLRPAIGPKNTIYI